MHTLTVPSFILPDWVDFKETIGEPEKGYWLGHGLIIWFEHELGMIGLKSM